MSSLLNLNTRAEWTTLLSARTLTDPQGQPAIIYLETGQNPIQLSRKEFQTEIMAYARALHHLGIRQRDLVIIAHVQNLESIIAFWGALLLGAIPSMFPTLTPKLDRQKYMESMALLTAHSEASAVLTTDDFAPEMRSVVACPVYASSQVEASKAHQVEIPTYTPEAEEIAFLQHSSGTTGLQKGVALSHQAVLNQLASYSTVLNLTPQDVIVSWLPLYHDMGLIAGFLLPLIQGIPLVLMSPFDWVQHPAMLFRAIHDYQGTLCWLPNFAYNHCARRIRQRELEGLDLRTMRAYINCSEPVRHASHQIFLEKFAPLGVRPEQFSVSYAMAENTFAVTQTPLNQPPTLDIIHRHHLEQNRLAQPCPPDDPLAMIQVSCGPAIPNVDIGVVDEQAQWLAERQVGEIAIKSDSMLTGYYKRPDLNTTVFRDGWYLTGDMGYMVAGEVYIVGRKKDLIITGGKNIYPQDIEAIVNTIPGLPPGRNVVFGVSDEREGTELIAVVAETETNGLDEEAQQEIVRAIRKAIAEQTTVTASFVTLVEPKWLLKTSSGKIARAANRDKWLATQEALE